MKLKKIVSLALAGVMAVSMLAGCNFDGAASNGSSSSSEQTATTGIAAAMNAVQSYVEFKDSTSNYLASAVKKATYAQLKAATFNTSVAPVSAGANQDAVANELKDNILATEMGFSNSVAVFNNTTAGSKQTHTYLYLVDDVTSEEVIATVIAKSLIPSNANYPAAVGTTPNAYEATYTGEVSIQKASKADDLGEKTASAYYVMVSITRTLGDVTVSTSNS